MILSRRFLLKSLALLIVAVPGAGCTRKFFRQRADQDVEKLLTEKNVFEPWKIEPWHVYPDARARFADPANPDRPPMPPDDPAAQFLSPNPQKPGKEGVGKFEGTGYFELLAAWDAMNRANEPPQLPAVDPAAGKPNAAEMASAYGVRPVQNVVPPPEPVPETCLPGQERPYLINLEQACELGLINSRDFQTQRENLYLTALPVSLQRFSFAAQLFALGNTSFESSGAQTAAGEGQRFIGSGRSGASKLFPTGATLLVQLANNFVFDVTNGNPAISVGNLALSLTQPLLQGGGRAVTLENLTQVERDLLYQIRAYARFRKQFYIGVAGGRGGGGGANFVDPSLGALATALSPSNGYLPTVRLGAFLDIDKQNVTRLQQLVKLFEAYSEGGLVSQVQVDTVKQQLLDSQLTVLSDELQLQNALDNFKIQLGMPPTVKIDLDRSGIKPITVQLERLQKIIDEFQVTVELLEGKYGSESEVSLLRGRLKALASDGDLVKGTAFRERIGRDWGLWEKRSDAELTKQLANLREERRRLLGERTRLETQGQAILPELIAQIDNVEAQFQLGSFEQALRDYERQPWKQQANPDIAKRRQQGQFNLVSNSFEQLLIDARNQRFGIIAKGWPDLPRICVDGVDLMAAPLPIAYAQSSQTALTNRLDLMNARGDLVDRWRQIRVQANSLLGVLNVGYSLDANSPAGGAEPFNFSSARTTQRVTVNGELPLVRRVERNNYRAALINYQRGRRTLQLTEDNILNDVRAELRQLRLLAENYRIQQQQIVLAYNQVEQSLEELNQPATPPAGTGAGPPPSGGASAAANTQQLLQAQSRLNNAQRAIYRTWIDYLTLRMEFFFDLEILPLDARGVWIDEHAYRDCEPSCLPADAAPSGERLPTPPSTGEAVPYPARR